MAYAASSTIVLANQDGDNEVKVTNEGHDRQGTDNASVRV